MIRAAATAAAKKSRRQVSFISSPLWHASAPAERSFLFRGRSRPPASCYANAHESKKSYRQARRFGYGHQCDLISALIVVIDRIAGRGIVAAKRSRQSRNAIL